MAFSIVGTPQTTAAANTTQSVTKPIGVSQNDCLVLYVQTEASSAAPGTPSGFTLIGDQTATTQSLRVTTYYKVAGASEPASYSVTAGTGANWMELALIAVRGAATSTPVDVSASNSNGGSTSTSATANSITTTNIDFLLYYCADWNGAETLTVPSGYTNQLNDTADGLFINTKTQSASGSTGTATGTLSGGDTWITWHIALLPASGGGATLSQTVSDSHSGLDILAKSATKPLSEAESSLDVLLKNVKRAAIAENISATDAWQRMRGALQLVLDTFSERDSLTRGFAKSPADAHSGQDVFQKSVTHVLGDAISQLDVLAKMPAKTFVEFISGRDSATATRQAGGAAWQRNVSDAHSALDVLVRMSTKLTADQWSSIDAFTRVWVAHLLITEVFSAVDVLAKQATHQVGDVESSRDTTQMMRGALLTILDALSSTDAQQKLVQHVLADAQSGQDTTLKQVRHVLADALSLTDKVTAGRSLLLTILEAISQRDGVQPNLLTSSGRKTLAMVTSLVASSLGINIVLLSPLLGAQLSASSQLGSASTVLPPTLGATTTQSGPLSATASIL